MKYRVIIFFLFVIALDAITSAIPQRKKKMEFDYSYEDDVENFLGTNAVDPGNNVATTDLSNHSPFNQWIYSNCNYGGTRSNCKCYRTIVPPVRPPSDASEETTESEETTCLNGYKKIGRECELEIICDHGFILEKGQCVKEETNCPFYFEQKCDLCEQRKICPYNFVWEVDRCVVIEPICAGGLNWNGIMCEVVQLECQTDATLRGNKCVTRITTCPSGMHKCGDKCCQDQPSCPNGFTFRAPKVCFKIIRDDDYKKTLKCPAGSTLEGVVCVKVECAPVDNPDPCPTPCSCPTPCYNPCPCPTYPCPYPTTYPCPIPYPTTHPCPIPCYNTQNQCPCTC